MRTCGLILVALVLTGVGSEAAGERAAGAGQGSHPLQRRRFRGRDRRGLGRLAKTRHGRTRRRWSWREHISSTTGSEQMPKTCPRRAPR